MARTTPLLLDCRSLIDELGVKHTTDGAIMRQLPVVQIDGLGEARRAVFGGRDQLSIQGQAARTCGVISTHCRLRTRSRATVETRQPHLSSYA